MANVDKKTNFILRFRTFRIRSRKEERSRNSEENTNNLNNDNSDNPTNWNKSFRRSLMKMHTRVKNLFQIKDRVSRAPIDLLGGNRDIFEPPNDYSSDEDCEYMSETINTNSVPEPRIWQPDLQYKNEKTSLINYCWYWGPISRAQVEKRLKDCIDGAFLVRDSSTDRYMFTLSFRSLGKLLHARINRENGYSLAGQTEHSSVAELIEDAMTKSRESIYCYTKTHSCELYPNYPVRLTLPISRYEKVQSLKYLSKFVIQHYVDINDMEKLLLPKCLVNYLQESG